jgi:hypothetical protein
VAWTRLRAPESLMGAAEPASMQQAVKASPLHAKYAEAVDRESAREKLAAKLEAGAAKAETDAAPGTEEDRLKKEADRLSKRKPAPRREKEEESVVEQVVKSGAFKDFMRTAAREIARGMFGTARRR